MTGVNKQKAFQLNHLIVDHINFIRGLEASSALSKEDALDLIVYSLSDMPPEVKNTIGPIDHKLAYYICSVMDGYAKEKKEKGEAIKKPLIITLWKDPSGTKMYVGCKED